MTIKQTLTNVTFEDSSSLYKVNGTYQYKPSGNRLVNINCSLTTQGTGSIGVGSINYNVQDNGYINENYSISQDYLESARAYFTTLLEEIETAITPVTSS
jgi:hypothetical protein